MTEVAASSSSFTYGWPYHVFLSFRGEDTRYSFTGNLYHNLRQRGIRTFIDDKGIMKGENITDTLFKVIEGSKTSIVVFSKNYASSTFCLKELVHVLKCMKGVQGRSIWCVFYHVDPSDVRHQRNSYKDAFNKYERIMEYKNLVDDWRSALKEAADLCSWHLKPGSEIYEYEIIEEIMEAVSRKINDGPLYVARYPVALESQVKEVCSLLNQQHHCRGATMVGICGAGGMGKTTLARAVYNEIQSQFKQYSCFVSDVREKSIHDLLKRVLSKTIEEKDVGLEYDRSATSIIKDRLQSKKVLLILDDIDKLEQLEILVGEPNWFGSGSIIIITTRDKSLLAKHDIKNIHEIKELDYLHAHKLLTLNAFKKKNVDPKYENVLKRAVKYACGLPLALEIIGSNLRGLTVEEWESALDVYEKIPHETIQKVLEVSYCSLEEIHKEVFLDIACFWKGCNLGYAIDMLQSSHGISPKYCMRVLIDKSLIKIEYGCLEMHDLIQDMGQEIVRQESKLEPGKRSRLWSYQNILHVLKENMGTEYIQGIKLDLHPPEEVDWRGEAFEKMKNLRVLIIRGANFSRGPKCLPNSLRVLEWPNYPSSLPSDFHPINLVILNLPHSPLTLEKPFERMKNLSVLNLKSCQFITQVPDVYSIPNLRELSLDHCDNLIEIHDSVGYLKKLETLSVNWCAKLCTFPHAIELPSLENLGLQCCASLDNFPEILEEIKGMAILDLRGTNLKLPFSIRNLSGLTILSMGRCQTIQLPSSLVMLPNLLAIDIEECAELLSFKKDEGLEENSYMVSSKWGILRITNCNMSDEFLPLCLPSFANMRNLDLSNGNFTILPSCIKKCCSLMSLLLNNCKHLKEITAIPPSIKKLEAINCYALSSESRSILLSQELHELPAKKFCLPAGRIPEWFEHSRSGPSISFWFYCQLPRISLCLVAPNNKRATLDDIRVDTRVNGNKIDNYRPMRSHFGTKTNPLRLFRIRDHMFVVDFVVPKFVPKYGWNQVEICANFGKEIGIHVIKQPSNNIRFFHPYNREGNSDDYLVVSSTYFSEKEVAIIEECGQSLSSKQVWSKVTTLCLIDCNMSDKFLSICLPFFPKMQILDLSGSNITILPACIKECCFLRNLTLNDCKHLREIAAIPPSIQELWAINCYSLSSETRNKLLSQELHKLRARQFCMPAGRIPEWFEQSRSGSSISFWFHYKPPSISVCLFRLDDKCAPSDYLSVHYLSVHAIVNGHIIRNSTMRLFQRRFQDHIFVVDFSLDEIIPEHKWNHVEISANFGKQIGIHVINQLGNNIRFADPYNRKGVNTSDLDDHSSTKISSTCLSRTKQVIFIEECGAFPSLKQVWSKLTTLCLINCNMSDEFLPMCLPFLPNMQILDLSSSNITILPACIKECGSLWHLTLNNCKRLREIAAIPPSMRKLEAINCYSLSSESTSILLSQELDKFGDRKICVPAGRIPKWFDHSGSGPSISFWFRNKLPVLSLGIIGPAEISPVEVIINGRQTCESPNQKFIFGLVPPGHMFVQGLSLEPRVGPFSQVRWNHVEIGYRASEIGIHVTKQRSNIKDLRFADPYNEKLDDHSSSKDSSICLGHEDFQECHDSEDICSDNNDLHQQHITEQIPESSENVKNTKGKEIVVDRDKANEEEDKKALEVTCKKYQTTCQKVQVDLNDQSTTRNRGQGGTGSDQRRDRLYLCLCILISSLLLYRYFLLLPWLLGFLGLFAVFRV